MAAVEIPQDEQAFLEYVQAGGQVETTDWMPDDYRAKLIKFIEMHGNSELMGVLPEREWILRAPTLQRKLALTAKVQDEVGHAQLIYRVVEDLGKPREQCLADLVDGQGEVPQRLPLPDEDLGRRRRDRLARRRGRDHQPEGAPQVLVRAVRADHEEDLLGGVVPHPPRPRRDPRDGHRHARAVRARAGGARPLVGAADAVPRQPDPGRRRPDVPVADQVAGQRGGAAAVPRGLRAADLGARARPFPTRSCAGATTASGSTPSPTGTSSSTSSPATARRPRSGSRSGARFLEQEQWVRDVVLAA